MNNCGPTNTYDSRTFKHKLYSTVQERNNLFGYDHQNLPNLQKNYHNTFLERETVSSDCRDRVCDVSTAPKDYYFNLPRNERRTVIGQTETVPNIYDDVFRTTQSVATKPNFYRTWEPFSTSAQNLLRGCSTTFTPHDPVEVAPRIDPNYWTADLNSRMYERNLVNSAIEQPYANFYNRQGMANLVAQNMRSGQDIYTVPLTGQSFNKQLKMNNSVPPATMS